MYIPTLLSTLLLLTTTALGNPVPSEDSTLQARGSYTCGSQRYTTSDVQNAMGDGIRHRQNNQLVAKSYPKEFRNGQKKFGQGPTELDPSPCAKMQLYEFPILPGGREYTGGAPGPDRVVFADSEKRPGAYVQCFVMTHVGGLYKKCT
jgi:hypothetical protein